MALKELYERPCFAACAECGEHGAIIFKDGSRSETIVSIEGGKKTIKELVAAGKLSQGDSDRIEDHLACSDLAITEREAMASTLLSLACVAIEDAIQAERARWN